MTYQEAVGIINKQWALKNKRMSNPIILKLKKSKGIEGVNFQALENNESIISDVQEEDNGDFKVEMHHLKTKSNNMD